MPLHPAEQRIWVEAMDSLIAYGELDPIERASQDVRIVEAAKFLLQGTVTDLKASEDVDDLLLQVGPEYLLGPREVEVALGMAEEKVNANGAQ